MSEKRPSFVTLLIIQLVAIFIYSPSFFQSAPQAWVLPVLVLFVPFALALLAMNTGVLTPGSGRTSLIFIQGVNIVARLMTTMPNLQDAAGNWDIALLLAQLIGMGLSWYAITQIEKIPLPELVLRRPNNST